MWDAISHGKNAYLAQHPVHRLGIFNSYFDLRNLVSYHVNKVIPRLTVYPANEFFG